MRPDGSDRTGVAVLYGAPAPDAAPDELDVTTEVETVSRALRELGWRPEPVALTLDLEAARTALLDLEPAFVFNLVETVGGRDRWAVLGPALLSELALPFTGTPFEGMLYSSGKLMAKRVLAADGVSVPPAWMPEDETPLPAWDGDWIVKPRWDHASVGIDDRSVVPAGRVREAVARRAAGGGEWFAEGYVDGRELSVAMLADGPEVEVLPPMEIRFDGFPPGKPRIVGYPAKWDPSSFEYRNALRSFDFAPSDRGLLDGARAAARTAWSSLGLAGYARVDLRVDAAGTPWVIDVNANPCLSPDAGLMAIAERAELDFRRLIERIVAARIEAPPSAADRARSQAPWAS